MLRYRSFSEQAKHYFARSHLKIPEGPIDCPSAWYGRDLVQQESSWLMHLNEAEVEDIRCACEGVSDLSLEEITRENFKLALVAKKIDLWRVAIQSALGFIVIRGLPAAEWGEEFTSRVFWGLGHHLGLPGGQNPDGELLGHVKNYGESYGESYGENYGENYGESHNAEFTRLYRTQRSINFHCDAADVVGLLCVQTAKKGGQSRIVSTVTLYNEIVKREPGLVPQLFKPFKLDSRGESKAGQLPYREIQPCCFDSSFSAQGQYLRTFYHSEYFRSVERHPGVELSDSERRLLDIYDDLAEDPEIHLDMWLRCGDIQFLSNHSIAHSRTAYEDHHEPELKRHLLRLWLSL